MPELPEVENVRRSLWPRVAGRTAERVELRRADMFQTPDVNPGGATALANAMAGQRIVELCRRGKQLGVMFAQADGRPGAAMVVHLGMTGSLRYHDVDLATDAPCAGPGARSHPSKPSKLQANPFASVLADVLADKHVHLVWRLSEGGLLAFRDPRRFGGVWAYGDHAGLERRWAALGPDALDIQAEALRERLAGSGRAIKAALLDQALIAGLGNIYVDELLFQMKLHPLAPAGRIAWPNVLDMAKAMRDLLARAVEAGGSSTRDYVDGAGRTGAFQAQHQVYERAGLPCLRCATTLKKLVVAGRTTVHCPRCQRRPRA